MIDQNPAILYELYCSRAHDRQERAAHYRLLRSMPHRGARQLWQRIIGQGSMIPTLPAVRLDAFVRSHRFESH